MLWREFRVKVLAGPKLTDLPGSFTNKGTGKIPVRVN